MKDLVPELHPSQDKMMTVERWTERTGQLAEMFEWSDLDTASVALAKLKRAFRAWYEGVSIRRPSWQEWKERLHESFPSTAGLQSFHREMVARRK